MSAGLCTRVGTMMKEKPTFSIIIPTYNHAHLIAKCLQSLLDQTFSSWEAIIVNNYSDDDTIAVVTRFSDSRIRLINFRNNGIIAASRNEGIRRSVGDYVAFLDSDDWWYPTKLETVKQNMINVDVIHHAADIVSRKGKHILKMRGRQLRQPVFVDLLTKGNPLITSGVCIRKSVLDKIGLFSEVRELLSVEDFDLWLRIAQVTDRFFYISKPLVAYWIWEGNLSKSSDLYREKHMFLYNKFKEYLAEEDRREADKYLAYCIGAKTQAGGFFRESRRQFYISIKSRNIGTIIRSIVRIIMSILHCDFIVIK